MSDKFLDPDQFDDEDRALYITGAFDGLTDLIAGQTPGLSTVDTNDLACLMRVVGHFLHQVLDPKEGPRRPRPVND